MEHISLKETRMRRAMIRSEKYMRTASEFQGIENLSMSNETKSLTSVNRSRTSLSDVSNGKHKNFLIRLFINNIIVNISNIWISFISYSSFFFDKWSRLCYKSKGDRNKSRGDAIMKTHKCHMSSTTCASNVFFNRMQASTLSHQSLMDANLQILSQTNCQPYLGTLLFSKGNLFKQSSPPMSSRKHIIKVGRMSCTYKCNGDNSRPITEMVLETNND